MLLHARKAKSYKGTSIKTGLGRRVFFGRCKSSIAVPVSSLFYASPHSSEHKANSWTSTRLFSSTSDKLAADIEAVGDKIRKLKATQAEKSEILPYINKLLALKAQFEMVTGAPLDSSKADRKTKTKSSDTGEALRKKKSNSVSHNVNAVSTKITPRHEDYSSWYNDVISLSGMAEQSPIRGCMVIKPWGMGIWDLLRVELDERIKDTGASNAYFPIFIPKSFLAREAEHVDGFAKECAVVTHHRLCVSADGRDLIPDPNAELEEPLIIRPTSETIIWNMFGKWIHSYRDLPLKINQWANVVRWELRTRPFLRSAEFLWQEGHTAHSSSEDAIKTATCMLGIYKNICKDMLAMPVYEGRKSPSERFAGADDTYTIEALMQNGWALQSGTSHYLGQNFAKAFDVYFQTETGKRELVWATSWGVSTRLVGGLIMTHSDDRGLSLPPPVAPIQVVFIPVITTKTAESEAVMQKIKAITSALKKSKIRVEIDDRENMRPGAKYFEWEKKGVPIRVDLGPRDLENGSAPMTIRHSGEKEIIEISNTDTTVSLLIRKLQKVHTSMLEKANNRLEQRTFKVMSYLEMKTLIEESFSDTDKAGFYLAPWKCNAKNEDFIKTDCKATIRCYPFDLNKEGMDKDIKCFYSGEKATHWALFARAF